MPVLAGDDAGDFDRTTLDAGISEQRLTQWPGSQPGQATAPTAQSTRGNHGAGEYPKLFVTAQLHFAGPGPSILPELQRANFVSIRPGPALIQHLHPELAPTLLTQASGQ